MPLPIRTLLVLPNPWAAIHPEKGPQGNCLVDVSGREGAPTRFVGATRAAVVVEKRPPNDPRGDRVDVAFTFPALKPGFLDGTPIEVPASSHYYRDRLADGSLVPADERTTRAVSCQFKSLKEAKAAGVAAFDADHGEGSWEELERLLADTAKASKKAAEPVVITGSGSGTGGAAPNEGSKSSGGSK